MYETVSLGLRLITANIIMVTIGKKKDRYAHVVLFYIWKRLFAGTHLANNNFFASTFPYLCPESLLRNLSNNVGGQTEK